MRLPTFKVPISINTFEDNLRYFLMDYTEANPDQKIDIKKRNRGKVSFLYELEKEYRTNVSPIEKRKIVEIEIIPIREDMIEVRSAILADNLILLGKDFMQDFLEMVYKNWGVQPGREKYGHYMPYDDLLYLRQQELYQEHGLYEIPGYFRTIDLSNHYDEDSKVKYEARNFDEMDEEEQGKIIKFNNALREGLPELLEFEMTSSFNFRSSKNARGVSHKTLKIASTINRIKDEHPKWSQTKVANQASKEMDEEINKDKVRYIYRRMGWSWKRNDS